MDSDKIMVHRVNSERCGMVLHLLREGIRQAGEPAHLHSNIEILPLRIARADVLRIGIPHDPLRFTPYALGGAVASFFLGRGVQFNQHRIINLRPEGILYRVHVQLEAICSQLYPICEPSGQIINKYLCGLPVTIAHHKGWDQLSIGINGGPSPDTSVTELPLLVSGVRLSEARKRALASIERVGLLDRARHRPAEMSGGQRQRFAIARALATMPSIVWADEPTGALDSQASQEIIDLMLQLNREYGLTFVWVTHALDVARQAQRLITMHDGRIEADQPVVRESLVSPQQN